MRPEVVLLEIAAQGVRGVALAGGRTALRPGYNVIAADGAALRLLVEVLVRPDDQDGDAVHLGGSGSGRARGGLTLVGHDGVTYRALREFGAGAQLQRFDPQRHSFAVVSRDPSEIAGLLAAAGVPPRGEFGALLVMSAAELPSRPQPPGHAASMSSRQLDPHAASRRLADLRGELVRAQAAEKLQYQLNGLQSRLLKLEETLEKGERLREALAGAEAALRDLAAVEEVARKLGDADSRVAAFEKATAKRDEALARVAENRATLDERAPQGPPPPFWKDPRFLLAIASGVAAVALGSIGAASGSGGVRYLALLDVPAFGLAGWVALRWIGDLEDLERSGRRRGLLDQRERKVLQQHERDTAEVRGAIAELKLGGIGELKDLFGRLMDAMAAAAVAQHRLEQWGSQPETRGAQVEKARAEEALRRVEVQLAAETGGFVRDPRSIEAEIARIEAEQSAPALRGATTVAPAGDPLRALAERAAAELGQSPAAAVRAIQARASEIMAALSSQRLGPLLADDRGGLHVQSAGKPLPTSSLPPPDRDLCWLALKLAWMERALAAGERVAMADDAFAVLPEGARRVVALLLKQMAHPGQILHGTLDPCFREAADHAA